MVSVDVRGIGKLEPLCSMIHSLLRAKVAKSNNSQSTSYRHKCIIMNVPEHIHSKGFIDGRARGSLLLVSVVVRSHSYIELSVVHATPGMRW